MKRSQWRRAFENRCVFSARLKAVSDRSGERSAGGRQFHVAGPLTAKLCYYYYYYFIIIIMEKNWYKRENCRSDHYSE